MHPDDIPRTVLITPFGLFEFLPPFFWYKKRRMMDQVLVRRPFVFVYLGDIIVAS
jgi:hypothetical protein